MKWSSFPVAFAIGLSLLAGSASGRAAALPDGSATSLDWEGVYRGVVPCADCEGIATTVTLRRDGSYHLEAVYQGRSVAAFEQQGKFGWDPTGGVIASTGSATARTGSWSARATFFSSTWRGSASPGRWPTATASRSSPPRHHPRHPP